MPSPEERQAKALVKIAGNTDEFVKALTALNENIVKVGNLFQAWINTPEVESVLDTDEFIKGHQAQEEPERMVGDKFVVTDSSSDFFNMRGEISEVYENSSVLAKLNGVVDLVPFFLNQVCILTEDKEEADGVPLRFGIGGPVVGEAKIDKNNPGMVTARIDDPRLIGSSSFYENLSFGPPPEVEFPRDTLGNSGPELGYN